MRGGILVAGLLVLTLAMGCGQRGGDAAGPNSTLPDTAAPALRIEEICPSNTALLDERGEDPGWVEIANRADTAVNLGAWRLRGRAEDGPGWRLPDTTLAPGERLVVFMSGLDIRRSLPAGDTVDVFTTSVSAWADSENEVPGQSRWHPWEFRDTILGQLSGGRPAFSAELVLADNSMLGMGWSSALVEMWMPAPVVDVSGRDHLLLRATIPRGQPLVVKFCQEGLECYKGSYVTVRGTGVDQDAYDIPLYDCAADFANLQDFLFEPPAHLFGTYRFTVSETKFYRAARRPHASFQLARKGATLFLEDTSGRVSGRVVYPEVPAGESWARSSVDGTWGLRETPTPDDGNPSAKAPAQLPAPAFVTTPGFHPGMSLVVEVSRVQGADVRCALGGAEPTRSSLPADSGIALDSSEVVRCAAFGPDGARSAVASGTFLLAEQVHLPVVSVVADPGALFDPDTGIYSRGPMASPNFPYFGANFWRDVEIPAHVELFENGRRSFGIRAGVSIYGNYSRAADKKSLSVQMREIYGPRHLEWPLFPEHPTVRRFKGFGLRNNGGNNGLDYIRDALMTSLTEGRGIEYQYSRHVVVFLNGRYWGIHELREKLDPDYVESRFGIDPASIDMIKNFKEVQAGSSVAWNRLMAVLANADLSDPAQMASVASQLDVDNYADYIGAEIYFANTDWPANNVRCWRTATPAGRWRMMLFDTDFGFGSQTPIDFDMFPFATNSLDIVDDWPNGAKYTLPFRKLLENPRWRERFVARLSVQLSTNLSAERVERALDSMLAVIAPEMPRENERWWAEAESLSVHAGKMRTFARTRTMIVRRQMASFFGLGPDAPVELAAEGGRILLEGVDVGSAYRGTHPGGSGFRVGAIAIGGRVFDGWSDGNDSLERAIVPGPAGVGLVARFR